MILKIAVVGTGYVGLSNSILLSQYNDVTAVDVIPEKVEMINNRRSPIVDKEIEEYLKKDSLRLHATLNASEAYEDADFVIVSTPTNYDEKMNYFDTSSVLSVIDQVRKENPDAYIVIKSTIPVGYTQELLEEYHTDHIMFSPEFLSRLDEIIIFLVVVVTMKSKRMEEKHGQVLKLFSGCLMIVLSAVMILCFYLGYMVVLFVLLIVGVLISGAFVSTAK